MLSRQRIMWSYAGGFPLRFGKPVAVWCDMNVVHGFLDNLILSPKFIQKLIRCGKPSSLGRSGKLSQRCSDYAKPLMASLSDFCWYTGHVLPLPLDLHQNPQASSLLKGLSDGPHSILFYFSFLFSSEGISMRKRSLLDFENNQN